MSIFKRAENYYNNPDLSIPERALRWGLTAFAGSVALLEVIPFHQNIGQRLGDVAVSLVVGAGMAGIHAASGSNEVRPATIPAEQEQLSR